ncbi:Myb-like_DNA-binding domain-containing protein [Hexamita inflata]|uniref:Myb-like DNA-binding domain-containing protein n=1 Tax=Hexamita inflata TaxID=28002 RepID=A0AA86VLE8_9EUKA|nr:Myb-like DNA-binding domain-containing protein [Hexamita inflata]CAI9970048.1 Myb-like DNA-binding domain-containing protein [Hexamita inflata]
MTQKPRPEYVSWSDAEIRKLIDASNLHKDGVINWAGVASHFHNRSPQQCKSFYNNRIRALEVKTDKTANDYYLFMISTQMQKPETPQQNVKKLFCECGTADMYIHIANLLADNPEFQYNPKFLGVMKEVIEVHGQLRGYLTAAFSKQKYLEVGDYVLSKELYELMARRMASFDAATVMQKIQAKQ